MRETWANNSAVFTIPRPKGIRGRRDSQKLKVRWKFRQESFENSNFLSRGIASMIRTHREGTRKINTLTSLLCKESLAKTNQTSEDSKFHDVIHTGQPPGKRSG